MDTQFLESNKRLLMELLEKKKGQDGSKIAFIESLNHKLAALEIFEELTCHEQSFLIRLFIASKLSVSDSTVSILDEKLNDIKLVKMLIQLLLYRYLRIHFYLQNSVARIYLCNTHQEYTFYIVEYSSLLFEVKRDKRDDFDRIIKSLMHNVYIDYTRYNEKFEGLISAFEIEQLKSHFLELSAQFEKKCSTFSSIDDFIFHGEKDSDSLNSLLASLIEFESKFLSENEKIIVFKRKFDKFQKKTEEVLEDIFFTDMKSEAIGLRDCQQSWEKYEYKKPFQNIKELIKLMYAVLKKDCYEKCRCKIHTLIGEHRSCQITHNPVILTKEMMDLFNKFSKDFEEFIKEEFT